jgi:hypothetical protein
MCLLRYNQPMNIVISEISKLRDITVVTEENNGANTDQPTTNLRRSRPAPPLFQWQSGVFTPNVHGFDDSDSGFQQP